MTRGKHEDKMMQRQFAAKYLGGNFPYRDESDPNTKQNTLRYSN